MKSSNLFIIPFQNNPLLESYVWEKDAVEKNTELNFKSNHQMKILQMYSQEIEKLRRSVALSGELAQDTFYVLQANLLLSDDVRDKYSELYKGYDQRGVKFAEFDENGTNDLDISAEVNGHDLIQDANLSVYMSHDDDILLAGTKRTRDQHEENDSQPTKKRVFRSIYTEPDADLNATQVLEVHDDLNKDTLDSTFAIKPKTSDTNGMKQTIQPLKDSNPNIHKDTFAVPKAKQTYKVKSTLTSIQREKENKRTPFKLRKSPRRSPLNLANKRKQTFFHVTMAIFFINSIFFYCSWTTTKGKSRFGSKTSKRRYNQSFESSFDEKMKH